MEPERKRVRTETDETPSPSDSKTVVARVDSAVHQSKVTVAAQRKPRKMFIADDTQRDRSSPRDTRSDSAESSGHEATAAPTVEEAEEALVREGDQLSGKALQDFLQKNFVEYADNQLFDVADLDELLASKP